MLALPPTSIRKFMVLSMTEYKKMFYDKAQENPPVIFPEIFPELIKLKIYSSNRHKCLPLNMTNLQPFVISKVDANMTKPLTQELTKMCQR